MADDPRLPLISATGFTKMGREVAQKVQRRLEKLHAPPDRDHQLLLRTLPRPGHPLWQNYQTNRLTLDRFGRRFGMRPDSGMSIRPVIKAPIAVQLNRIAFALYAGFFGSFLWRVHKNASVEGTAIFLGMIFFCVLGLFYSFIRARRSRWIMAVLGLLIPGLVFASLCFLEFSRPEGLADWFLSVLAALVYWFAIPIMLSLTLFKSIYNISFEKRGLVVDIRSAQKCLDYFKGADKARAA